MPFGDDSNSGAEKNLEEKFHERKIIAPEGESNLLHPPDDDYKFSFQVK